MVLYDIPWTSLRGMTVQFIFKRIQIQDKRRGGIHIVVSVIVMTVEELQQESSCRSCVFHLDG